MKFIKKFNEELEPRIYSKASKKLAKMGHTERAKKLQDWADVLLRKREMANWNRNVEDYSKFGTFKIKINDDKGNHLLTDDFYLDLSFDSLGFEDSLTLPGDNVICLFGAMVPTNEETIKKCIDILPDGDFSNGSFWAMVILIHFDASVDSIQITGIDVSEYDKNISGKPSIADRRSAVQFKNLLKNIFGNSDFNYPSGMIDTPNIYDHLENVICVENSFSSNYGFSLDDVAQFIDKISPNEFFKN